MIHQKTQRKLFAKEKLSNILLVLLFVIRFLDTILSSKILEKEFANDFTYWYGTIVYVLGISVIWLNKDSLQEINVDKSFVSILIFAGLILSVFYLPPGWGIFVGLASLFLYFSLRNNQLRFRNEISQNWGKNTIFVAIGLLPILINYLLQTKIVVNVQSILSALDAANLHSIVFEELLFRGMLWAYLLKLGMGEHKIILGQAFLFWIAHLQYFNSFWTFWFALPVLSIVFGILVKRTNSLTQSTVSHFIYNFSVGIIRYSP